MHNFESEDIFYHTIKKVNELLYAIPISLLDAFLIEICFKIMIRS